VTTRGAQLDPRTSSTYKTACLGAAAISAALGLIVAVQRLSLIAFATGTIGPVAFLAALLIGFGGVLVFTLSRPYCGAIVLWLGSLIAAVIFVAGPSVGTFGDKAAAVGLIAAAIAVGLSFGDAHQWLVADQSDAPRPATQTELPGTLAVVTGMLAWIGAAFLGDHAINAAATVGSALFVSEAFIVIALLAAGAGALGAGLLVSSSEAASLRSQLLVFKLIVGVLILGVAGVALIQFVSWIPSSAEARTACCVGHQFDWRGVLVISPLVAACLSGLGALQIFRLGPTSPRSLFIRCLGWPLCIVVVVIVFEVAHDLLTGDDFAGLYGTAVVVAAVPYALLAATSVVRARTRPPARQSSASVASTRRVSMDVEPEPTDVR
jgi:hypothetical protein